MMHIGTPRKHSSHSRKLSAEYQEGLIVSVSARWSGAKYGIKTLYIGMKATLDRYITKHYTELFRYARFFCSKYNTHLNPDVVINNAYIHCVSIQDPGIDPDVKGLMMNSIKRQVLWQNLDTNKQERVRANDIPVPDLIIDDTDLNDKIAIEQQYHKWKSCVDIYRDSLNDNVKIRVAKAYFDDGYTTSRSMAKYFNIPNTSAHNLIAEIKRELKTIYHENQRRIQG